MDGLVLQRTLWNSDPILCIQESKIVAAYIKATPRFGDTKNTASKCSTLAATRSTGCPTVADTLFDRRQTGKMTSKLCHTMYAS